jgi:hypothetical protein
MTPAANEPEHLSEPGRRGLGLGSLAILCVVSLCCAMALSAFVERRVVAPACKAYAVERGAVFKAVDVYSLRQQQPGPHCLFTQADGSESSVWLQRVLPFVTDLWVSVAMDIELSTPVLWVMTSLLWLALARLRSNHRREPAPRPVD